MPYVPAISVSCEIHAGRINHRDIIKAAFMAGYEAGYRNGEAQCGFGTPETPQAERDHTRAIIWRDHERELLEAADKQRP